MPGIQAYNRIHQVVFGSLAPLRARIDNNNNNSFFSIVREINC